MNVFNENEQNAMIDALKYTSDVVSELTLKINNQDDEISYLKNKVILIETEVNKILQKLTIKNIKTKNYSNLELNTEDVESTKIIPKTNDNKNLDFLNKNKDEEDFNDSSNSYNDIKSKNFEVTSIGDTEINKLRKLKAGQLVDKLIQKKNEINNIIEHKNDDNDSNDCKTATDKQEGEKKVEEVVVTRRRNKIMRRF